MKELHEVYKDLGERGTKWLTAPAKMEANRWELFASFFQGVSEGVASRAVSTFKRWLEWLEERRPEIMEAGAVVADVSHFTPSPLVLGMFLSDVRRGGPTAASSDRLHSHVERAH